VDSYIQKPGGRRSSGENLPGEPGSNLNYNNMCFPETEEGLPAGWNPLHVQKGFKAGESVVSTFSGWSISNYGAYIDLPYQQIMRWQLQNRFTSGTESILGGRRFQLYITRLDR
jgi:hypothetical protein